MSTAGVFALFKDRDTLIGYRLRYKDVKYDISSTIGRGIGIANLEVDDVLQLTGVTSSGELVTRSESRTGRVINELISTDDAEAMLGVVRCAKAGVPDKYLDVLLSDSFKRDRVKAVTDRYLKAVKFRNAGTRLFLYDEIRRGVRIPFEDLALYDTVEESDCKRSLYSVVGIAPFKRICREDVVYLDTETTGLDGDDEIIELGITDNNGVVLYSSMFKPTKTPHPMALKVNGITVEELSTSVEFKSEMLKINDILKGRVVCTYNKEFDKRLVFQTIKRYFGLQVANQFTEVWFSNSICAMQSYMAFNRIGSSFISLVNACKQMGVVHEQLHRATDDCIMTMKLCRAVAEKEV